jgi:itaconate CoA-transferase
MRAVPALGEHTVAVLREAGVPDHQISDLMSSGAAVQHRPTGHIEPLTESVIA